MRRTFALVLALLGLAACAPTGGLMVSETARDLGGNLFVEEAVNGGSFLVLDGEITPQTSFVFEAVTQQADVQRTPVSELE